MNKKVLARLLRLYPVDALRATWEIKGHPPKDDFVEIVAGNVKEDEIAEFCRAHHGRTKQRVILFDNNADAITGFGNPLLHGQEPRFIRRTSNDLDEFYLVEFIYKAVVGGPPWTETSIEFAWPVGIAVDAKHVRFTFTVIEKNISTYLDGDLRAVGVRKEMNEDTIIGMLIGGLDAPDMIAPLDINKGVKTLWANGCFDSDSTRFKGAKSTSTETMDEKFLLKRDLPEEYAKAMKAPLLKTVFETLKPELKYPPQFTVDPTAGELVVTRYSDAGNEVDNVVRAILAAN